MKIGEIIYEESESGQIKESMLENYMRVAGVWALYGKENESSKYECLNVGTSTDVGYEILYDIGCLHFLKIRNDGTENYVNQFNRDCGFKYKSGQTQEYLYPIIASKYNSFKFVYVHNASNKTKESEYAKENNAIFWRNGSPFGVKKKLNVNRKDIQFIGEYFQNGGEMYSREELLEKLENDLGYDNTRANRLITECEKNGFLTCIGKGVYTR